MKLTDLQGKILYEGRFTTIRRAVEAAVRDGADLSGANLRRAMLRHAVLDGAVLKGACLWGATLDHAQMTGADLSHADCRAAQMKEICLAESICRRTDFRGAYLQGAIVREGVFIAAQFSCPSVFSVPWEEAGDLNDATYWHRGETPCPLTRSPIVIGGLPRRVVVMDAHVLIGTDLHPFAECKNTALQR